MNYKPPTSFNPLKTEIKTVNGLTVHVEANVRSGFAYVTAPEMDGLCVLDFDKDKMCEFFSAMAGQPVFLMTDVIKHSLGISPENRVYGGMVEDIVNRAFIKIHEFINYDPTKQEGEHP